MSTTTTTATASSEASSDGSSTPTAAATPTSSDADTEFFASDIADVLAFEPAISDSRAARGMPRVPSSRPDRTQSPPRARVPGAGVRNSCSPRSGSPQIPGLGPPILDRRGRDGASRKQAPIARRPGAGARRTNLTLAPMRDPGPGFGYADDSPDSESRTGSSRESSSVSSSDGSSGDGGPSGCCPTIPMSLGLVRKRQRRGSALREPSPGSPGPVEGSRGLMLSQRKRHHAYAAMHSAAARSASRRHQNLTVLILAIALVTSLTTTTTQEVFRPSSSGGAEDHSPRWALLAANGAIILVGGLTAINNFLGYQKREERHRGAQREHIRAADIIAIALACDADNPGVEYDYSGVLRDIQDIHDALKKHSAEIPEWIAVKYPEYEMPWRLKEGPWGWWRKARRLIPL